MATLHRRNFLTGSIASLVSAPAIVRVTSIMPVRAPRLAYAFESYPGGFSISLQAGISIGGRLLITALTPPREMSVTDVKYFDPTTGERVA